MIDKRKNGPWALIVGGSEGVGEAFALKLAAKGIDLVLVARKPDVLAQTAEKVRSAAGAEVRTLVLDVAADDAMDKIVAATEGLEIGTVIHNVGGGYGAGLYLDHDLQSIIDTVRIGAELPCRLVHHFAPAMVARKSGAFIFVGSMAGNAGSYYYAGYSAAKSFMQTFGEAMWAELGPEGVDVLTLILGSTDTPSRRRSGVKEVAGLPVADPADVASQALDNLGKMPVHVGADNAEFFRTVNAMDRKEAAEMLRDVMMKVTPAVQAASSEE